MEDKKYLDKEGLKYLWSKIQSKTDELKIGYLNITLTNNQDSSVSATVKVTINGTTTSYSYSGSPITLEVESDSNYAVEFSNITGYLTPPTVSGKVLQGAVVEVAGEYKACKLIIKIVNGSSCKVAYDSYSYTMYNNGTRLIPWNSSVTITPNSVEGYHVPKKITFVANTPSVTHTLNYEPIIITVGIWDTNGNMYTASNWNTSKTVLGVGLNDGEKTYIMAPFSAMWHSEPYYDEVDVRVNSNVSIPHISSSSTANVTLATNIRDYYISIGGDAYGETGQSTEIFNEHKDGKFTTDKLYQASQQYFTSWTDTDSSDGTTYYGKGLPAVEYVKNYNGGSRKGQWYLPSCFEWYTFIQNMDALDECAMACYGEKMSDAILEFQSYNNDFCLLATSTIGDQKIYDGNGYKEENVLGRELMGGKSFILKKNSNGSWRESVASTWAAPFVIPFLRL